MKPRLLCLFFFRIDLSSSSSQLLYLFFFSPPDLPLLPPNLTSSPSSFQMVFLFFPQPDVLFLFPTDPPPPLLLLNDLLTTDEKTHAISSTTNFKTSWLLSFHPLLSLPCCLLTSYKTLPGIETLLPSWSRPSSVCCLHTSVPLLWRSSRCAACPEVLAKSQTILAAYSWRHLARACLQGRLSRRRKYGPKSGLYTRLFFSLRARQAPIISHSWRPTQLHQLVVPFSRGHG